MLSIGKLAAGQAEYYLEQARGSVTRVGAVGSGVEDYYVGGGEAPGEWMGDGAALLRLGGVVGDDGLRRTVSGEHPATGASLGRQTGGKRVPGFDVTWSAPKSVSVLFGIGDDRVRGVIQAAHDRAVADAFGYLERQAAVTRRGAGGVHSIPGRGLVAAAFRHRTSRAGDPQLHTHVLVANVTLGADGRWSALDGRRLYAHGKTAGYVYEARLRAELTRELGVEWEPVRNGIADIAGVPAPVLRGFSRRRAEIDAELRRNGTRSPAAAQVAALETRRRKDYSVSPERLVPEWRERAASLGLEAGRIPALLDRAVPAPFDGGLEERIAARLASPDGLTHRRSTFTRRDVIQGICEALPAGAQATTEDIERAADRFLRSDRAVVLAVGEGSGVLRRRDGRVLPIVRDERLYSTPELLALEARILECAVGGQDARRGGAHTTTVESAIAKRPTTAGEQAEMVRRLTRDGASVTVVVGQAGTGKTFALAAAREAWEASGHTIVGAALARRAARELGESAGIPSTSVAALLDELRRRPRSALPPRSVLVVDEASMVSTRQLAELVDQAANARAKLVLVGDHRQLSEIEVGGAFRALARRLPAIELTENRRQVAQWERDALALLRDGDAGQALDRYEANGRVVTSETGDAVRGRLVADWWSAGDPDRAAMIAFRRADVADLNGRARPLMRARGRLGSSELALPGGDFARGDRVVLRHNDPRLGVANGDRGVISSIDPSTRALDVDVGGRRVRLDAAYLDRVGQRAGPSVMHGYAITGHSAQGLTCDRAYVLVSGEASREWCYTALSRGRVANRLYAVAPDPAERAEYAPSTERAADGWDALATALGRSTAQTLATDAVHRQVGRDAAQAHDADSVSSDRRFGRAAATVLGSDAGSDRQSSRSRVQTLTTDAVDRDRGRGRFMAGTLTADARELARLGVEREEAQASYERATRVRGELERQRRHALAVRARGRHDERIAAARAVEAAAGRRLEALRSREADLRGRLSREHARRLRESRAERRVARVDLDRDIGLGR